jgi:hypothetical protein
MGCLHDNNNIEQISLFPCINRISSKPKIYLINLLEIHTHMISSDFSKPTGDSGNLGITYLTKSDTGDDKHETDSTHRNNCGLEQKMISHDPPYGGA